MNATKRDNKYSLMMSKPNYLAKVFNWYISTVQFYAATKNTPEQSYLRYSVR